MLRWLGPTLALLLSGTAACSGADSGTAAPGASASSQAPQVLALVEAAAPRTPIAVDADPEGMAAAFQQITVGPERHACAGEADVAATASNFADRTRGWAGGDLMDRLPLPGGRVLWIFGDTFVGDVDEEGRLAPAYRFVRNSAIVQDGMCFDMVETDDGAGWVTWLSDDTWLWPLEATIDNGLLHVFMVRVQHVSGAAPALSFEVVGGALAVFTLDDLSHPSAVIDGSPTVDGKPFGFGVVRHGRHHYAYAHVNDVGSFVSRAPAGSLADFGAWEYWTGTGWHADATRASTVADQRIRVARAAGGGFVSLALPFGSTVVSMSRADAPEGPFVLEREVALAGLVDPDTSWAYQPLFMELAGEPVLTVNVLPWDTTSVLESVESYGPRFVPLDRPPTVAQSGGAAGP